MAAKTNKVRWSNYSIETISTLYSASIANELENMSPDDYNGRSNLYVDMPVLCLLCEGWKISDV